MPLLNKDGTTYTLVKPNPLMSDQSFWKKNYIMHGKFGQDVKCEKLPEIKPIIQEEIPTVQTLNPPPREESPENKIQVWCLPAYYKEIKDGLYGDTYRRVHHGKKFLFEAMLLEQDDLLLKIWCDTKTVTQGSILYPKTMDKRWWRVNVIKEEDGGYTLLSIPSDYHPDFSD
jgi:hypothetical protein